MRKNFVECLEQRQLFACAFEESTLEDSDSSQCYFGVKLIAPVVAFPLGFLRALPEVALTLVPTFALYGLDYARPSVSKLTASYPNVIQWGATAILTPLFWSLTDAVSQSFLSGINSADVSESGGYVQSPDFEDVMPWMTFGSALAISSLIPFLSSRIVDVIPQVPTVVKAGTLVGVTFVAYPLAYDTINVLIDPMVCTDPYFCNGCLSAGLTGYVNALDNSVQWLANHGAPSGKSLPILDPIKIYERTSNVASVLFTALVGSSYFPDSKAKLPLPHIEMNNSEV